ncbi:hypothetical protein C8R45DRAFT_1083404 [Mycena sanguinolenta]|nr:hypothetical protein C8R45DRAFT_1083404 [Mycena sanguinolenta]
MSFSYFSKIVLLFTALALQAWAASPQITKGDFKLIQVNSAAVPTPLVTADDTPTIGPFVPTAANLIVNTTVPQGVDAEIGWIFNSVGDNSDPAAFDGSFKNITVFYTPPGGVEQFVFGIESGPDTDFCGIFPGFDLAGVIDSSVLGTYYGRWMVDFGQSTQPDAPVDPTSGCGPLPFNITTVEFSRTWEVAAA